MDIKNVFLNDTLDEKIYMEQAPGFVTQEECAKDYMLKSIYDLEQSTRDWLGHFASVIQEFSLCHAQKDHSVF